MPSLEFTSILTCPFCQHAEALAMLTDACLCFHACVGCGVVLRPKPGDCCVFCSYGSVPCPPVQAARRGAGCCRPVRRPSE
jgi:hypothetical protein